MVDGINAGRTLSLCQPYQSGMSEVAKQLGRSIAGLRRQTESNMEGQRAER